jgi:small-conductance mechanosensitive channel
MDWGKIESILIFTSILISFLAIGIIFENIALNRILKSIKKDSNFAELKVILDSLRKPIILWFVLLGIIVSINIKKVEVEKFHIEAIKKIIISLFIFSLTHVLSQSISKIIGVYMRKREIGTLPATSLIENVIKVVIYTIGILIILQLLGISITPILTTLGVGGLAVALALQSTLSNFFAGLQILASKQIRPGDYIKLDSGEEGYVVDITWRNIIILTLQNNIIFIPNSKIINSSITNFSMPDKELAVPVNVGISYQSDLKKVEQITKEVVKEVMKEVDGGVPEFEPLIRFHTFGDFSINFTVILRAKEFNYRSILIHEFIKRLHERYKKEGIEIPFPIRTVYLKSEKQN